MKNSKILLYTVSIIAILGLLFIFSNKNDSLKTDVYHVEASDFIYNDYKPFLVVEVKNGRMISATFDCVNKEGELITNNRELKNEFLAEYNNSPESLIRLLSSEFLIKQSTETLKDVVSVTDIREIFAQLAEQLLEERISSGNEDILIVDIKTTGGNTNGK